MKYEALELIKGLIVCASTVEAHISRTGQLASA